MPPVSQLGTPTGPKSGDDTAFAAFFAAFRAEEGATAKTLGKFFQQFDESFRKARVERVDITPHINLLRIFGLEYAELRHSDVLAWFLNPRAEHEQGAVFANALLSYLGSGPLRDENYQVVRERHGHTDVALYVKAGAAVFIENKVRHVETDEQVSGMIDSLTRLSRDLGIPSERRFALFLTDAGTDAETGPKQDSPEFLLKNLRAISRIELFESFHTALLAQQRFSPLLRCFLESYLNSIRHLRIQFV